MLGCEGGQRRVFVDLEAGTDPSGQRTVDTVDARKCYLHEKEVNYAGQHCREREKGQVTQTFAG